MNMVEYANKILAGPEIQPARMDEYFGYCRSCGKGRQGYTIRCDEVEEDEMPDICPFCGSRAEVKPLWGGDEHGK